MSRTTPRENGTGRPVPEPPGALAAPVRRMVILAIGSVVLAVGLAMTVLPGPAVLVIPAGLAILASEFRWARRLLVRMRQTARRASRRLFGRRRKGAGVG